MIEDNKGVTDKINFLKNDLKDQNISYTTQEYSKMSDKPFKELSNQEEDATLNLLSLMLPQKNKKTNSPLVPSLNFIENIIICDLCDETNIYARIQNLIYSCVSGDLSAFVNCGIHNCSNFNDKILDLNKGDLPTIEDVEKLYKIDMRKNTEHRFICKTCSNEFTTKNGLKYHLKNVHSKHKENIVKPYLCPFKKVCKRKYKNKNGLFYHLEHYHKKDSEDFKTLHNSTILSNMQTKKIKNKK